MSAHGAEHEELIVALVWGDGPEDPGAVAALATECDECLAYLFELAEDEAALGGASERLERALEEVMAWAAVRDDARAPAPAPRRR
jgi:hypothetical protein